MTVDAADASGAPSALREQGLVRLRAGEFAQAIELLGRAAALDPADVRAQVDLGIALQGARRHAEALEHFERAQTAIPNEPAPWLHAAFSLLAIGKADPALHAADEAGKRAPRSPQAQFARGRALLELDRPEPAEQAFAAALREAPAWADAWVNCGIARSRQGAIERAIAAIREALRHAPNHAVAKAQLAALERARDDAAKPRTEPGLSPRAAREYSELSAWKPNNPPLSLGLAVGFLRKKPAFARLQFGEWSQVLITQIDRGHFFFVIDQNRKIRGFLGWALTEESLAEQWVEGRAGLRNEDCLVGDCVIINGWAADSGGVNRFIVDTGRRLFAGKRTLYFKRHYPDGRARPMRLNVNDFVAGHLARSTARGGDLAADPKSS